MKLFDKVRGKIVRSVVRYGIVGSLANIATWPWRRFRHLSPGARRALAFAADQSARFDREFGVDTHGLLSLTTLDIAGGNRDHGEYYLPSEPALVREALATLPIAYNDFAFIDYGSGKGRVLLLASEFPFKFIVGVEFAAELHRACQVNLRHYRNPASRCGDIRPVHQDATTFDPPEDVPLVLYFYNPFDKAIFDAVLNRLDHSLRRHPRPVWIVYIYPKDRQCFDAAPFLKEVSSTSGTSGYCIYKSR